MRKRLWLCIGMLGLSLGLLSGCTGNNHRITVVGSTALQLLADQAGNNYRLAHPGVSIVVQGGGSGTGLSQIQAGAVQIGTSDIFAENQAGINAKKLIDHQVAVVGIVPIVNKDAKVKNLSTRQLRAIFTGKLTNWKQVGGANEPITIVNRSKGSGTRATFEATILAGQAAAKAQEQDSNGAVKKIVSSTPGTISYLSFPYASDPNIQKLAVDHVQPTDQNVSTNKWRLWSYEHMYTKGRTTKEVRAFIRYMLSAKVQKQLVPKLGYISVKTMQVVKDSQNRVQRIKVR